MTAADSLCNALERNPIIAAIKTGGALDKALLSPVEVVFLLGGNICELDDIVARVRERGKLLYIHMDLIEGMGKDFHALQYMGERVRPNGIITTKAAFVKHTAEFGLGAIQRMFMLDSMSLEVGLNGLAKATVPPGAVEILPGILPDIIRLFTQRTRLPIIAGGLIRSKDDAVKGLAAGATGISTSNQALWYL